MYRHYFREWACRAESAFGPRHHGRHGFGRFAGGFADEGEMGGRGFRTGRKLSGSDLQLLILALIAVKPSHGYEIIKALEERSNGFYAPSPGVIYPALTYLEEIGYATVAADASRKLYSPTEAGLAFLKERKEVADAILSQIERVGQKMEGVRRAFSREDWHAPEMMAARRLLRSALDEKRDASLEEQRRIAEILARAARDISGN
ncbi:transcriptional regulator, PadR family [Rhizobiales bacterium GAS191]|jgi:DNA-binding PadR family transcriptional regulator|nr:transcriptional regulator, PadR family [Rhizobiales bacterium GAS113]SED62985.1 transcriptional regulator, PadR family [Rhizobiales bacterium GAS191]